jgi:precorrin-6Y C5,15-methyltransferase (decarboxylating)
MTKQEIRAAIRAKLAVRRGEVIWDIGAGTGSVSVELAQASAGGPVFAVECSVEGCELIKKNREHFGAWNLRVIRGMAEDVIGSLPAPDAVFIGGSKGQLETVIRHAVSANPKVRICVSAILLETMTEAVSVLTSCGREAEVVQIQSSKAKTLGKKHMMMANNPVFLITG